ncbi:anaerobic benzoate catabolism transcriptional regulator [Anaerotignum neopropionicum]|uniref:Anaerobic benzoate catabolism transcriptional regulator n=1 Tax=Anaerotignum neopropionicum TaxID=36847 RepID=A0A136WGM8_9FIRM|nr:helix-turn-helix transcriptional regulator [Anaerotignum neopropionicum]KXL53553.1 anaerobic benzoate catabolism transcriptional regulator [Anaerotignum neopropionicum]
MYEEYFSKRVSQLRTAKGISARDMSLSLGQSESYINKIENGKAFPSMQVFFYICEYFGITPKDFFDEGTSNPALMNDLVKDLNTLDEKQILNIHEVIKGLKK